MSLGHKINKSPLLSAKDAETFSEYPKTDLIASTWNVEHETSADEGMQPLHTVDNHTTGARDENDPSKDYKHFLSFSQRPSVAG